MRVHWGLRTHFLSLIVSVLILRSSTYMVKEGLLVERAPPTQKLMQQA